MTGGKTVDASTLLRFLMGAAIGALAGVTAGHLGMTLNLRFRARLALYTVCALWMIVTIILWSVYLGL